MTQELSPEQEATVERFGIFDRESVPTGDALIEHFKVCGCHDSWDQCPCAEESHPADGSCDCCEFGIGICGPKEEVS